MFVGENWQNHETYNGFIRGFGIKFEDFTDEEAVNIISLLVKAGLNQEDILEAVIEKVLASTNKLSNGKRRKMILNLIATTLDADAASSSAFN